MAAAIGDKQGHLTEMVGPNGFEPSTSSVSRKRSRPAELRAYMLVAVSILMGGG